ncbi:MAG: response regulator transcription factor [Hydrogenobacter thermophilus]|uniref:response regulator transcription factor n=1 Tax=Hydrogenobacter thermophilus TaxID=940 RepID=UPI000CA92685|nr:response regulator transcription factor [Hydrogenobacter thermophilus]QWK19011.1 MAG: response regulator transcription factor [Hydrogenobacter thermophilus]GBC87985.1 Cell cycle response regulator CtrA [bacterium HR13]
MRLLLIEDDASLAKALKEVLEKEGYHVSLALDGRRGYELALCEEFDLIVLDLLLPSMGGEEVLKSLRESGVKTPVLMLTVVSDLFKKVDLFALGADDYLTKPFHLEELLARVRAIIRRSSGSTSDIMELGEVRIEMNKKRVLVNGQEVPLTATEYTVLEYLCLNRGRYVSREEIIERCLSYRYEPESNTVEVFISRIRKKLGIKDFIKSSRGFGYRVG